MTKEKSTFVKIGYISGIILCFFASLSLIYASYLMINWMCSDCLTPTHLDYSTQLTTNKQSDMSTNTDYSNSSTNPVYSDIPTTNNYSDSPIAKNHSDAATNNEYSNTYTTYEYARTGKYSDTISDTIGGEIVIFQEISFENYDGPINISYTLYTPADGTAQGLDVYFVKSNDTFYKFANSSDETINEYMSCQQKNVMINAQLGSCIIKNGGGGIVIYNPVPKSKQFTLSLTIEYNPYLTESN